MKQQVIVHMKFVLPLGFEYMERVKVLLHTNYSSKMPHISSAFTIPAVEMIVVGPLVFVISNLKLRGYKSILRKYHVTIIVGITVNNACVSSTIICSGFTRMAFSEWM